MNLILENNALSSVGVLSFPLIYLSYVVYLSASNYQYTAHKTESPPNITLIIMKHMSHAHSTSQDVCNYKDSFFVKSLQL